MADANAVSSTAEDLFYQDTGAEPPASPTETKPRSETPGVDQPKPGAVETEAATEPADHEPEPTSDDKGKSPRLSWRELRTSKEKAEERAARAEAERDLLKQQALERNKPAESSPVKSAVEGKPKEEDYATFGEYLDARDQWNREQWDNAQTEKQRQAAEVAEKQKAEEAAKAQKQTWTERVEQTRTEHKDFDAVAYSPNLPINAVTHYFLMQSTIGPKVLYALGSDLKEARRIEALNDHDTYVALVKLEADLLAKAEAAKGSIPKITQAPRPATPVLGVAAGAVQERPIEEVFYGKE